MSVTETFHLDLRRSVSPAKAAGRSAPFPGTRFPRTEPDAERGLHFPLEEGAALALHDDGKAPDSAGAVTVVFSFGPGDNGGQILRAWSRYLVLRVDRAQHEVGLAAYGHSLKLFCAFRDETPYALQVDWDCSAGLAVRLLEDGREVISAARNVSWQPYNVRCTPFEIGGSLAGTAPEHRRWEPAFSGWIREVRCFDRPLRPPGMPRVPASAAEGVAHPLPPAPGITPLELHDPPILDSPYRYDIIPDRLASYRRFRRRHPEFASAWFASPTAFDGLLALSRLVTNLWPHTEYWPWPRRIFDERGEALLRRIKEGEMVGMCGGYAHVMEEVCWSLGIPAHRTQVYGHSSFEVYDHTHDKWICLETDPMCQAGVWEDRDGVPLCIGECIDVLEQDHREPDAYGRLVRHRPNGGQVPATFRYGGPAESWFRHCYNMMFYYQHKDYRAREPYPFRGYLAPWLREYDKVVGPRGRRTWADDWRRLYWSCDRVIVRPRWKRPGRVLHLALRAFQAQFADGFEVRVDGAAWKRAARSFDWELRPGVNRIEVRTRNKLGVTGHPWRAVLHKAP